MLNSIKLLATISLIFASTFGLFSQAVDFSWGIDYCNNSATVAIKIMHEGSSDSEWVGALDIDYPSDNEGYRTAIYVWEEGTNDSRPNLGGNVSVTAGQLTSSGGGVNNGRDFDIETTSNDDDFRIRVGELHHSTSVQYETRGSDPVTHWIVLKFTNIGATWKTNGANGVKMRWQGQIKDSAIPLIAVPTISSASVDASCSNVAVTWTNPTNITCPNSTKKIEIYRSIKNQNSFSYRGFVQFPGTTFNDGTAAKNTEYDYKVRAHYSRTNDYSDFSAIKTGRILSALPAPSGVAASSDNCDNRIRVTWNWNSSTTYLSGFTLQRRVKNPQSGWVNVGPTFGENDRSYEDTGVSAEVDYEYRVLSRNTCSTNDLSGESNIATGRRPGSPPVPYGLSSSHTQSNITVNWVQPTGNTTGFIIERTFPGGGGALVIDNIPAHQRSFVDTDVLQCVTYTYTVKAKSLCFPGGIGTNTTSEIISPDISTAFATDGSGFKGSKGYYQEKVELEWNNTQAAQTNTIKIFRRVLNSGLDSSLLITLSSASGIYNDLSAQAGILYEYFVIAEGPCENDVIQSNTVSTVGFRSKIGQVAGKVSYGSGIAVKGVKIVAENNLDTIGNSIKVAGGMLTVNHNQNQNLDNELLIETWFKPSSHTSNFGLIEKSGSFRLFFDNDNHYKFQIIGTTTTNLAIHKDSVNLGDWHQIAGMVSDTAFYFFLDGKLLASGPIAGFTFANTTNPIELFNGLNGYGTETRIWNKSKSLNHFDQDHSRFMIGHENDLVMLLPMSERAGNYAYDRSKLDAGSFNRNHALFSNDIQRSEESPTKNQLSFAAYTNDEGNYSLALPYRNAGESYLLTPIFKTHEFDPSTELLFIGDASSVYRGINFTDISAFDVTGSLRYKDTNCPVKGAFLKIDGENVVDGDGNPITTDDEGQFNIEVPIGEHHITVDKAGHVFSNGRFPEIDKHNFQEPLNLIPFEDSTLIKVVGRVVGGLREAIKPPGLNRSKNNIGKAVITFESELKSGCSTQTIETNQASGEYVAMLPPLEYKVQLNIPENPIAFQGELFANLNISGTPMTHNVVDTVFLDSGAVDTVEMTTYNERRDFIYRVDPKIVVKDPNGIDDFIGDTTYTYIHKVLNDTTVINLRTNPFQWPVLEQKDDDYLYRCLIKVFEEYQNFDAGYERLDSVPTVDGSLQVNNELSHLPNVSLDLSQVNTIDSLKFIVYSFKPGAPNFLPNESVPEYSFTKKFKITLNRPVGTPLNWLPVAPNSNIPGGGDRTYRAYLLGGQSTGEQYVTKGPQVPEYILRDPPGSGSSATREIGSTKVEKSSWSWNLGSAVHTEDKFYLGAKFSVGLGVSTATEIENNTTVGFKAEISGGNSGEQVTSTENTKAWSTNDGTDQPGRGSDLYIGKSKNVQFGIAEHLVLVPDSLESKVEKIGDAGGAFIFSKNYGLSIVPNGYETQFIFDENHIRNYLIPDLINLRNVFLLTAIDRGRYTSNFNINDDNFAKNNDDPVFGSQVSTSTPRQEDFADWSGPSYTFNATSTDSIGQDSVRMYNDQIWHWENAIRLNEWEKANIDKPLVIDSLETKELDELYEEYKDALIAHGILVGANIAGGVVVAYGLIASPVPGTSVAGYATFAVTTATGIALAELQEEFEEYHALKDRIEAKYADARARITSPLNFSVSAGSSFTSSVSHSTGSSYTTTVDYKMNADMTVAVSGKVNNNGVGLEKGIALEFESGRDWTTEEESTETVSFTIHDPDQGDFFSTDVYSSILGFGPIFKRRAGGQTACPHEDIEVAEYYVKPGELTPVLSHATRALDKPTISSSQDILVNVPSDEAAVFDITLGNAALTGIQRIYNVETVSTSNPFGAIVRIDGSASISPSIPGLTEINKTLTVSKGPGPVYEYDSLLVIIYAPCQYAAGTSDNVDIADSIYISAHFLPKCTDVTMANPENQWVLNNSFNDTLTIDIVDYNINTFDLRQLRFDYKASESPNWIPKQIFWKDTSGMNNPNLIPIPVDRSFTRYDWEVGDLSDGDYDLRVVSVCDNAESISPIHKGYMDRIDPHAFGTPSPADGILDPNDDISIKFNELIDIGSLTDFNFDVRGVVNGSDIRHQESISFDGMNDYAEIPEYNLSKRSFTIEFWARRNSINSKQILFSQGLNDSHQVNLGFDNTNRAFMQIGNKLITANNPVSDVSNWYHYTFVYDRENSTAEIIVDSNTAGRDLSTSNTFAVDFTGAGNMILGKSSDGTPFYFNGFMHELRLWSRVRTGAEVAADFAKNLSGREIGLIGNWSMDEAIGNIAKDKVRSRNAVLNGSTWSILPESNAFHLDGTNEYLEALQAGSLAFGKETDITFEFWFKGMNQNRNMTVLSNGKSDGSGNNATAWEVYFNSAGELVVQNDGNSTKTTGNLLDNDWHHFSAVITRSGNISLYVDGDLVNSTLATLFKTFAGPKLWVGCRGWLNGTVDTVDQFFTGYLDDIRIWELARTSEQVKRDIVNSLTGDEPGLVAYYPFDDFQLATQRFNPTLLDKSQSSKTYNLTLGTGTNAMYSSITPPIKLARPIKLVDFTYSVNEDEIVISLGADPASIENVTLDISVEEVKDLAGNVMQAPRTWIAYIDKNQVYWNEEYMEFEKMEGDPLSFEANVRNSGGASQSYVIGNLPDWLTASPSAGVIDPNSSLKINFTVNPLMDIGEFTQDIYVTGDFGYNEKLVVDIKNTAIPPEWNVNPNQFQYSMNITGTLRINDVISIDEDDIVSAFINDELVGVSPIEYFENQGLGLIFLTINSHNLSGDIIEFRVWDASEGRLIVDVTPNDIIFTNGDVLGNSADPVDIKAFALSKLTYALLPGWNWISFPNNGPILTDIPQLFSDLSLIEFDQFESLTEFASINSSGNWMGNLDTVVVESGYKLYVDNGGSFDYEGIFEDPNTHAIQLDSNWNWVGMIAEQNLDINTALATLDPVTGDLIKSQKRFAVYDNSFGWVGNLRTLVPQEGYLIKLNGHLDELIYPSSISSAPLNTLKSTPQPALASLNESLNESFVRSILDLDEHQYGENMSMVVQIDSCHLGESYDMWYLVALSGAETRGVAEVSYDVAMDAFMAYLTVYGESNESLEFRLVKGDMSNQVLFSENETFGKNDVYGSPAVPYKFACMVIDGPCPTVRELTNVDMLIDAKQSQYRAALRLISDAIINNERNIQFFSGREVILQSGFEVKQLSSLEVNIEDCPVED